ncbi:glycine cleavage system protein GcvH [Corynebacterium jeikeium]|jgi:glycine cleavage system H protein|uniref:Glycine cleavage system H protein n=1 Tax=Corynebacterium jeikeium (strain K411) TaxID=306537 RepID=GCSH_CORJK|nr:glycine cleavage system protein GcvH [Corynebacterium jeikeium]Q4JXU4.1 RecName: Full=Glycine cleavage system H protein [Corynebacterium jeikeium K411]EEW16617.1 glycine cleavage system H protein [Corynebacterium jeikeium ATCC 43734]OOD30702.1 glycine cleavage system protein H [Corynebacterium jeikeium]WCZ52766.1 Glycine cleavage system H protein [Corynebacterium jeikeium]CAI36363.1 glycine cleavage system H protein [Corynebacterium jeikeium K411]SCX01927.1 Glycine cleavage system H protei
MTALPTDFLYSEEHEWVNTSAVVEGETVRVGITHIAAEALGDIVFVELPEVGSEVEAGEAFGEVESTKSVSDIYAPVSGEVVAVNEALEDNAGLINEDPYGEGWLYEVKVTEAGELMEAEAYQAANE